MHKDDLFLDSKLVHLYPKDTRSDLPRTHLNFSRNVELTIRIVSRFSVLFINPISDIPPSMIHVTCALVYEQTPAPRKAASISLGFLVEIGCSGEGFFEVMGCLGYVYGGKWMVILFNCLHTFSKDHMFGKFPTHKGITIVSTCSAHHHLRYTLLKKQFESSVFSMAMQANSSYSSSAEQSLDMESESDEFVSHEEDEVSKETQNDFYFTTGRDEPFCGGADPIDSRSSRASVPLF
uniref:Uncharacterized protein n=1 Tax=Tanacetum cinerariifolium TaxID=118510 RepID=A0A6L2JEM2_TANCI|nr:hypothetical protein [Tanacetum cinerariifolium]